MMEDQRRGRWVRWWVYMSAQLVSEQSTQASHGSALPENRDRFSYCSVITWLKVR
jgi:hypothetical protein